MTAYATQCLSFRKANLALFFADGSGKRARMAAMPCRAELFLATFAAGRTRAATLGGPMLADLRLIGANLRGLDPLRARGIRFGGGLLLLLLLLLFPSRRFVRRRARHLQRWRHAAIDRERMALGFGLGVQSGRVVRTAREAVDDLRLRARRRHGFHFSRRRRHRGRLFRARDIARPDNRHQGDKHGKTGMEAGTHLAASLRRAGRSSDKRKLR